MKIFTVRYFIECRRNGHPKSTITAIIIAENEIQAEEIYKKNHSPIPEKAMLSVTEIGDENSKGEIYSF